MCDLVDWCSLGEELSAIQPSYTGDKIPVEGDGWISNEQERVFSVVFSLFTLVGVSIILAYGEYFITPDS